MLTGRLVNVMKALNRVNYYSLVRYRFKLVVLMAIFVVMLYLRISTGDQYFDRASTMCVSQSGHCDDPTVTDHTFMIDEYGNSICVEKSTPCVAPSFIFKDNVTLSDDYLTANVVNVKREDIFPNSTVIIVLSFIGICISFLFDHSPATAVQRDLITYSEAMRQWYLQKVGILVNATNFGIILASAYTYKEMFHETCNAWRNPEFCAELDAQYLVIKSVVDAESELMDNYRLCWVILGVALFFGMIVGNQRMLLFSISRSVTPTQTRQNSARSGARRQANASGGATTATYTSAADMRAAAIATAARRYIIDAAKPGIMYFLSPSKCCSICLGRLAVEYEIGDSDMESLVRTAQRKWGDKQDVGSGQCENSSDRNSSLSSDDDVDDMVKKDQDTNTPKADRRRSISEIELSPAEFAERRASVSEAAQPEAAMKYHAPDPATEDESRLMDAAACVVELPCGHVFHFRCIRAWVDAKLWNVSCPECRTPIINEEEIQANNDPNV